MRSLNQFEPFRDPRFQFEDFFSNINYGESAFIEKSEENGKWFPFVPDGGWGEVREKIND